jgi:hypothetical protein
MSKLFTVKDFIEYNAPCFNCNRKININIGSAPNTPIGYAQVKNTVILKPNITSKQTEVDLLITYKDGVNLIINHKTNKFETNNFSGLKHYLNEHNLFLNSACLYCFCNIISQHLIFDLVKKRIEAVGLWHERLKFSNNKRKYHIDSWFDQNKSELYMFSKNDITGYMLPFDLPLTPKYKFKNKQELIDKCNLCLTFQ